MRTRSTWNFTLSTTLFSIAMAATFPAAALPGISLSEPAAATADDECMPLVQIKYPWLNCTTDAHGNKRITNATVAANASWDDDRQLPLGYEFVEGHGGWLPVRD